jgi:threonine/homoserine/homoserine lactone efflux protein
VDGLDWFAKAVFAGFVVAVPVGAIGALCLRRAFMGRWGDALITGWGAATADGVLAAAAIFGLSLFGRFLTAHGATVRLVGGLALIGIGLLMIRDRRPSVAHEKQEALPLSKRWRLLGAHLAAGFGLTIINPATLVAFVGVFAGLGLFADSLDTLLEQWFIVFGAFLGSMIWWTTLTLSAMLMRRHAPIEVIATASMTLGLLLIGLGVYSVGTFLQMSL